MSEIKYGLISKVDAGVIEKTIDFICNEFTEEVINVCEIGIYAGQTGSGIRDYLWDKGRKCHLIGIENNKDGQELLHSYVKLIIGNSNEVYNQLEDESQHLIVVDGNHSFPYVVSDYYCYKSKVKVGGYLAFHDYAPQAQGCDWQRMGNENDNDMSISVQKALLAIGLIEKFKATVVGDGYPHEEWMNTCNSKEWKLVFQEWDEKDRCGGFAIFKKIA